MGRARNLPRPRVRARGRDCKLVVPGASKTFLSNSQVFSSYIPRPPSCRRGGITSRDPENFSLSYLPPTSRSPRSYRRHFSTPPLPSLALFSRITILKILDKSGLSLGDVSTRRYAVAISVFFFLSFIKNALNEVTILVSCAILFTIYTNLLSLRCVLEIRFAYSFLCGRESTGGREN